MKVGSRHLTYCSNIHAGESWASVRSTLGDVLPDLRQRLGAVGPLGVGLRLSAVAAETLDDPAALAEFSDFLDRGRYYVFTMNGFPYGAFHQTRVKDAVYEPDWRDERRITYTDRLARILAHLTTDTDVETPSISTVPGGFRSRVTSDNDRRAVAIGMLRHIGSLAELRRRTGRTIVLAIEPEPACQLETTSEVVSFVTDWLRDPVLVSEVARDSGVEVSVDDVRVHAGLCLDTCHLAVAHEDPVAALDHIAGAGIPIHKVQVSAALQIANPQSRAALESLRTFADDTYLHQVVEEGPEGLTRFVDLPEAIAAAADRRAGHDPWRVHFHVPIFLSDLGPLQSTQAHLASTLREIVRRDACRQFEVETYTWDVLPDRHKTDGLVAAIARELQWCRPFLEPGR